MSALKIKKGASSHSAYDLRDPNLEIIETHTLAVVVDNEAGVLARVIGLFAGRGYNIESLTVAEIDHKGHLSRITVVTRGTRAVIEQIKAQLGRLVPAVVPVRRQHGDRTLPVRRLAQSARRAAPVRVECRVLSRWRAARPGSPVRR